jgi:hypothetical protein
MSNKTAYKMSGFYGKKNYNAKFTAGVETVIHAIESSGLTCFNEVLGTIKEWHSLLKSAAKKMEELRLKLLSAPKDISEIVIIAENKIKQDTRLSEKDFIFMKDAIARLYMTVKGASSETDVYNSKQQIESYINNVQNRKKVIEDHYKYQLMANETLFVPIMNNSEAIEAFECIKAVHEQLKSSMLYLNDIVDTTLAKERIAEF